MERYETTEDFIRPFPEGLRGRVKSYVAMCDPYKGACRKDQCTFAHSKAEQEAWNKILRGPSVRKKGKMLYHQWEWGNQIAYNSFHEIIEHNYG